MPQNRPHAVKSSLFTEIPTLKHGFFTRKGGISTGLYEGLNCGLRSRDKAEHILKNRQAALHSLSPQATRLCGLYQIHSATPRLLQQPWDNEAMPQGDAIVTAEKNIAISILTADCAPVLLADPDHAIIGAVHAGWQGALGGIIENTIRMMCDRGAQRRSIRAAIGPCIAQKNYEVGAEFRDNFIRQNPNYSRFFKTSPPQGKYHFDLKGFAAHRLEEAGIEHMDILPRDTYADHGHFFSYRRACHEKEADYGRQISMIMLTE